MPSILIRRLDGTNQPLSVSAIDAFSARLRGELLRSGDPGYDEARAIWNAMIDRRPGLILRCADEADVVEAVRFAAAHDLLFSIRGGGHNIAGTAVADGGLMIDLSALKEVLIDPVSRTVRAQPGIVLGDLDRAAQAHGLVVPAGAISTTGLAGLTLGGGFGWLTRSMGFTSDHLRSVRIVTADGSLRTASAAEHPDLFWAVRGGGGNFGAVTAFEFSALPLGPTVVAGLVLYPIDQAPAAIRHFRDVTAAAPEELTALLFLRTAPAAPFLPPAVHGTPVVGIAVCYAGPVEAGERAVAPLKAFGAPLADTIKPKPFAEHQTLFDSGQPHGRRYYWKSEYLSAIGDELSAALVEHCGRFTSPFSSLLLMHLGGAGRRAETGATAVGFRDAEYIVNVQASWEDPTADDRHVGWARAFDAALRPFSIGTYVNFLTDDEVRDAARQVYDPTTYARLAEVKRRYDPDNRFRLNKNVAPAPAVAERERELVAMPR
jgi:FAD/FMN-containing dehydrogenase